VTRLPASGPTSCAPWRSRLTARTIDPVPGGARLFLAIALLVSATVVVTSGSARAASPSDLQPPITWKRIPFGDARERQMAAYSKRHYGVRTWRLSDPKVIIEHYTDGTSFNSAWSYFASNQPHMGELPGVCAHFVIDTDGTIYQLVNLRKRCRHAIGMNWTAIGIEMVGTSAPQILHRRPQIRAALHLTLWLMARDGIGVGNVIGHAETLESPYHHERYASWRCLTHSDWQRPYMQRFRHRLRRLARHAGVRAGPAPEWVDSGC
jgi:N-acetylmuramoyl-L-alanine amidase